MAEDDSNLLCCAICLDVYKNPRVLPCYHSFCSSCIDRYMNKNSCDNQFKCPFCRKKCSIPGNGVEGFVSNFYIEAFQKARLSKVIPCDLCGTGSKAENRCNECVQNFCDMCSTMHMRLTLARDHVLQGIPVEDVTVPRCRQHPDVELTCRKCVAEADDTIKLLKVEHMKDMSLQLDSDVLSIAPVRGEKVWVSLNYHPYLLLIDHDGKILQSVPIRRKCWYATADNKGDAIISTYSENCLLRASQSGIKTRILSGLCNVKDVACIKQGPNMGDIFWTQYGPGGGVMKLRLGGDKPINILPRDSMHYICSSSVEDLLCVSNINTKELIVFGSKGNIVSKYSSGSGTDFDPHGICFDQLGCIVVANGSGKNILRVSKSGQLIQILVDKLDDEPLSVDFDEDRNLWVGFGAGKMQLYKML